MKSSRDQLSFEFLKHPTVQWKIRWIRYTLEAISIEYDEWESPFTRGPGMYVAIVSGHSIGEFANPMGSNAWPVDLCPCVHAGDERFYDAAWQVARNKDGAVVISVDGMIHPQLVRFRDPDPEKVTVSDVYADWMGSRHMSALDTSAREGVVTTITLSEETGRVTEFVDGTYVTTDRSDLGKRWRLD